jgi:hypothetical protein
LPSLRTLEILRKELSSLIWDVKLERQNKEANSNPKKDEEFRESTHSKGRSPRSHRGEALRKEDHIKGIWSH